jgi:molecular chaperone DnaK (HSP70)
VSARYTVGIDLGTSHTVVAYADPAQLASQGDDAIRLFPIPQPVGPGEVAARELLPSVRYHPAPGELGAADLPAAGAASPDAVPAVLGYYARELGAQVPGRLVSSAKSWLSHPGVDRTAAILPWGAPEDVPKVSPVAASASYLAHVQAAWNAHFPDAPLAEQDLVLTVPASFDEGARSLTLVAAQQAGLSLNHLRLLEEPQAAFHDWLFRHRADLNNALGPARLVLVCDVGGGTTDLTLIQVAHENGQPQLTRIGVGDHLMLGGDNMDLALAHLVERRMGQRTPLSAARLAQLVQRCRIAKEQLLAADAPEQVKVTLLGGGSQLIGGASSVTLQRDEVLQLIVDGFMPREPATTHPRQRRAGIVEFGLPYPADAAITRHLAAFLSRHAQASRQALGSDPNDAAPGTLPVPDTLLLNGGVFRAPVLAQRLADTLGDWAGHAVQVLHNDAPDVAVARGAVAYALVRAERVPELGRGIGGGSARSYLLVLDDAQGQRRGICVLPRGTPENTEVILHERTFALRLGQAVRFHLVSSVADTPWQAGELIDLDDERFVRLPPITTVLPAPVGQRALDVHVRLSATMTEVGTLEVHCARTDDPSQRWLLAFELRGGTAQPQAEAAASADAPVHPRLPEAVSLIDQVFGTQSQAVDARTVRQLRARLEQLLGARESWDLPLLRALFDALWARMRRRRRSAEHERVWLNLAGYCLRPGLGTPLDSWRIEQIWPLFEQGIQYTQDSNNWSEWWTLWRRAAGGLDSVQQLQLLELVGEHLMSIQNARRDKDPLQNSYDDMVRLVASLERVPAAYRVEVGNWLVQRLQKTGDKPHTWWAVGRLGARISLYGNAENVVPPETASRWLQALLALDWKAVDHAAFAATTLARMSGDRVRDVPAELREAVVQRLQAIRAPVTWSAMVRDVVELDEADQKRSFGEALPVGLRLIANAW